MNRHRSTRAAIAVILTLTQILAFPPLNAYAQSESKLGRGRRDIDHYVSKHELVSLNARDAAKRVRRDGRLTIASASQNFEIELTPHDLRASNYTAIDVAAGGASRQVETGPVRTYKGTTMGAEAEARFTVDDNTIEGVIITGQEKYFVESLRKYKPTAKATDFVLYKSSDVYHDGGDECAVTLDYQAENAFENFAARPVSGSAAVTPEIAEAGTAYKEVELATEADFEYVSALGGAAAANNEILSILNQVEGIYKAELGISFRVSHQSTWTDAADPYTKEVSSELLEEFRAYWNINRSNVQRDLAHLWTGKDIYSIDSTTGNRNTNNVGVAYKSVTCNAPSYGYGLTERRIDPAGKVRVTAHEIGHNFGASHPSDSACDNTIMSATGSSSTVSTFCQVSRDEVNNHLVNYSGCLGAAVDPSPRPTLTITSPAFPSATSGMPGTLARFSLPSNISSISLTYAVRDPVSGSYPTKLGGLQIIINNVPAEIVAVGKDPNVEGFVDFILPPNTPVSSAVAMRVTLDDTQGSAVAIADGDIAVQSTAPFIWSAPAPDASGAAFAISQNSLTLAVNQDSDEYAYRTMESFALYGGDAATGVTLYGTGLSGAADTDQSNNSVGSINLAESYLAQAQLTDGRVYELTIEYVGRQGGLAGLDAIIIKLAPQLQGAGRVAILLIERSTGRASNLGQPVFIRVR
ncbi:MAG: M12 family metallo-peptidase [Pyrinomonadaceae bacterium]